MLAIVESRPEKVEIFLEFNQRGNTKFYLTDEKLGLPFKRSSGHKVVLVVDHKTADYRLKIWAQEPCIFVINGIELTPHISGHYNGYSLFEQNLDPHQVKMLLAYKKGDFKKAPKEQSTRKPQALLPLPSWKESRDTMDSMYKIRLGELPDFNRIKSIQPPKPKMQFQDGAIIATVTTPKIKGAILNLNIALTCGRVVDGWVPCDGKAYKARLDLIKKCHGSAGGVTASLCLQGKYHGKRKFKNVCGRGLNASYWRGAMGWLMLPLSFFRLWSVKKVKGKEYAPYGKPLPRR